MAKRVSAAEAKAKLSALVAEVAYAGQHVVIERRGRALAALVSIADLERLEAERPEAARPRGALALAGAWRDVPDEALDALISDIYVARAKDKGREVIVEP